MIRYVLNTIQKRFTGKNPISRVIVWFCTCAIMCLENFLIFLNRNAYIEIGNLNITLRVSLQDFKGNNTVYSTDLALLRALFLNIHFIAIHGYGFCKSARKSLELIVNNDLRVAPINSIGDCVLFLGKVAIVTLTLFIGHELIKVSITNVYIEQSINVYLFSNNGKHLIFYCRIKKVFITFGFRLHLVESFPTSLLTVSLAFMR